MILHGKMLGTTICEIDITKKEGKERYLNAFKKYWSCATSRPAIKTKG
ncbi:hypothetical protein LWM68_04510 [Niabella sp. W65]|nr:hypothetical protein [Niabella sp. W65]MCH7362094.1 hypothetical protein [Niabella sp. W65]ULT45848.1 hypothetical protein KRR40_23105 [Niabella sp. I65]